MGTETAEKLRKALELLGPNGENWVARPPDEPNTYCSTEAIFTAVSGRTNEFLDALKYMKRFHDRGSLSRWNDAPGRTFAEVENLFEQAIRAAESEGSR